MRTLYVRLHGELFTDVKLIPYIAAGKRFEQTNIIDLERELERYNLSMEYQYDDHKNIYNVRGIKKFGEDSEYRLFQTRDWREDLDEERLDVIVGRLLISKQEAIKERMLNVNMAELDALLKDVQKDIPDANIIFGCYLD
ncbi:MAG TPA: hypothetical protein VJK03_04675 [Candidatus Nanoarchaeia archaeon]|nr:hypothetical protein [Candidatus Nanoarchaeia archaeon]